MIWDIAKNALAVIGIAGIVMLIGAVASIVTGHGTRHHDDSTEQQPTVKHLGNPDDPQDHSPHTLRITIMRSYYITEHVTISTEYAESIHDGHAWLEFPIIALNAPADGHLILDEDNIKHRKSA
jgi:uncharacterized protein (DUF39 family)